MNFFKFAGYLARRYYNSVNFAIEGIIHAAKTQAHVRFHLIATCFLLLFCYTIGIEPGEFIVLTTLAAIVVVAEMFNSAIEVTVDIASPHHSEKARIAKDIAAGAVLVAASISAIIGFWVLYPYVQHFAQHGIYIAQHGPLDLLFGSLIIVLVIVIMIKAYVGQGHPLRGGIPSGHASLVFSLWVNVMYVFQNPWLTGAAFLFAIAIAASRVVRKIHSAYEVWVGIALGSLVTWALFLIFYQA